MCCFLHNKNEEEEQEIGEREMKSHLLCYNLSITIRY